MAASRSDYRVGITQPKGGVSIAIVGVVDPDDIFWPECEVSFAGDGHVEVVGELLGAEPQDWKYLVAQAEEWSS